MGWDKGEGADDGKVDEDRDEDAASDVGEVRVWGFGWGNCGPYSAYAHADDTEDDENAPDGVSYGSVGDEAASEDYDGHWGILLEFDCEDFDCGHAVFPLAG